MAKRRRNHIKRLTEIFVIFYSRTDKSWIAHGLRTDQFGTGDCILHALIDGMKAVDQTIAYAKKHPDISILRRAPNRIYQIAQQAENLPKEVYEIAHKRLYGKWPESLPAEFPAKQNICFKYREEICV